MLHFHIKQPDESGLSGSCRICLFTGFSVFEWSSSAQHRADRPTDGCGRVYKKLPVPKASSGSEGIFFDNSVLEPTLWTDLLAVSSLHAICAFAAFWIIKILIIPSASAEDSEVKLIWVHSSKFIVKLSVSSNKSLDVWRLEDSSDRQNSNSPQDSTYFKVNRKIFV